MYWTSSKNQAASNEQAAKPAKRTILRRLLSHHELATLLLLLHAPIDAHAKPEIAMLQEAGLVEQVPGDVAAGATKIRLTNEGNAVLQGLGLAR
ncbi:MAG: hypothetical protein V4793_08975 [Paraburkholderia tropica]|uniref:ArsR family transcriptional regulator n=1 Tax=Paraburkholderia tropica TaxID=92647 RepID=A0ABX5MX68_9BURK|nr:hypothetical protein [Paraburkholderia tropica]MBB2998595.1 hypothetical protein [Paraburkholderia tropica]MBB6318630.1 hypothetical protein [Paraburkholderia tropica]MDE1139604.1 hypothetical protein [Paraburkholderia tropica]PXX19992.1 hypothetical protein C7400_102417 [Paraburkholderia tropica]PZW88933.1 hypothetical protein C7399_102417 [Paraburkholderia tropica]